MLWGIHDKELDNTRDSTLFIFLIHEYMLAYNEDYPEDCKKRLKICTDKAHDILDKLGKYNNGISLSKIRERNNRS